MACPGSGSWVHAWIEVKAVASASCADVAAEIQARASGKKGWSDPHNGGIYNLVAASPTEIHTKRTLTSRSSPSHRTETVARLPLAVKAKDSQLGTFRRIIVMCAISTAAQQTGAAPSPRTSPQQRHLRRNLWVRGMISRSAS